MAKPKDVLSPADYSNYRNVRAVSALFILIGGVLAMGGMASVFQKNAQPQEPIQMAVPVGMAVAGLAGVIGGVATLRGSRRWAPLIYLMAAIYIFAFPIGTILSLALFMGLSRYLGSMERVRSAATEIVDFQ
jgi:hypothetical protein